MNRRLPVLASLAATFLLSCAVPKPAAPAPVAPKAPSPSAAFSGGRVFVVEPVSGLGLDPAGEQASLDSIAAWAQRRGIRVVDAAKTWQVLSRARAGRSAATGAACGNPLMDFEAVVRWQRLLGADGLIDSSVTCDKKGCTLSVLVLDRVDFLDAKQLAEFDAPYDPRTPEPRALSAAIAHLAPKRESADQYALLGDLAGPQGQRAPLPEQLEWDPSLAGVAGWLVPAGAKAPGDGVHLADVLEGGTAKLRACFGAGSASAPVQFAVSRDGRVTDCKPESEAAPRASCACGVLAAGARLPAAMRGRRFRADIRFRAAETVTPEGYIVEATVGALRKQAQDRDGKPVFLVQTSDPSIRDWSRPNASLVARCYANAHGAAKRAFAVQVSFDSGGQATSVHFDAAQGPPATPAELQCLRAAFLTSRAPCPAVPTTTAYATVDVKFRPTPKTAQAH